MESDDFFKHQVSLAGANPAVGSCTRLRASARPEKRSARQTKLLSRASLAFLFEKTAIRGRDFAPRARSRAQQGCLRRTSSPPLPPPPPTPPSGHHGPPH